MSQHHAFVIEADGEEGIGFAEVWVEKELEMTIQGNPDIVVLRHGLFSVADARKVTDIASGGSFVGEKKVVIISASRVYHEAQNALLKVFEEPPADTYLFLVVPSLGGLLPTLRSRVQILSSRNVGRTTIPEIAEEFLKADKNRRGAIIKKLTSGKDDEKKRELRDETIALVNGIEAITYMSGRTTSRHRELLEDIQILRVYLYDRSAPVKSILEHLALVVPKDLV